MSDAPPKKDKIKSMWQWRNALTADQELSSVTKLVGLALSFHHDFDRGNAWRDEESLAKETALHPITVRRNLAVLVKVGALKVAEKPHRGRCTRYTFPQWRNSSATPMGTDDVTPALPQEGNGVTPESEWRNSPVEMAILPRYPSSTRGVPDEGTTTGIPHVDLPAAQAPSASPTIVTPQCKYSVVPNVEKRQVTLWVYGSTELVGAFAESFKADEYCNTLKGCDMLGPYADGTVAIRVPAGTDASSYLQQRIPQWLKEHKDIAGRILSEYEPWPAEGFEDSRAE